MTNAVTSGIGIVLTCALWLFALGVASELEAVAADPPITSLAFTPGGESVVATSQAGVTQFRWPDLEPLRTLEIKAVNVTAVAFSPSGKRVAVGGGSPAEDGTVEILSWPGGDRLHLLTGHSDTVTSVVWLGEESLVSGSLDHEVRQWTLRPNAGRGVLKGHSRGVTAVVVLANGETLVSAGVDQTLRVWDLDAAELIHGLPIHTLPVHDLAVRPDSQGLPMVASASDDKTVRFWQPTIGRMVRFVRLPSIPLSIAWTPDGSSIVAACQDGRVRVIDPLSVVVTKEVQAIRGWAYALAIHPDSGVAVVGGVEGQLRRVSLAD
ncbi:MAG: WD40 repeat domain-containing protein [Planctomycetota bacterium]